MATEWDIFSLAPGGSDDPPTYLATLYEAREKSIRVELDGTGSGSFAVNRSSPECTEAILAQGNLVKVRIPEIHTGYLFAFFLETGDFTLISSDEAGGEMLTFGGRGALAYLEYGCAWSASYIAGGEGPIDNVWRAYDAGTGSKPGQILRRLIEEFQDPDRPQHPIPLLTVDFDYDVDSNGDAWISTDATDEFSYQSGETGLAIVERLIETRAITIQMGPDFDLHAYNAYGRDLAETVRFERGVNIATELRRSRVPSEKVTHMLVAGETDHYGRAVLSGASGLVTKEGYVAGFGTGATALVGIGAAELERRSRAAEVITFPIANRRTADVVLVDPVSVGATVGPDATDGFYLPGPDGTLGDFWLGDTVRVHTGSGPFDFNEVDARVLAITISRDDDNGELIVIPELEEVAPAGVYMVGLLTQRSNTAYGADIVPRGEEPPFAPPYFDPWTWVGGGYCGGDGPFDYPFDLATLGLAGNAHPTWGWGGAGGLNGTARPTGHSMQVRGACGPPVILEQLNLQLFNADLTAPTATAPADGIMFALFSGRRVGDPSGSAFTLVSPGDATVLANTMASANPLDTGFFPRAWLGSKVVTAGQSVDWILASNMDVDWGCMIFFIPGGADLEIVEFLLHGSTGTNLVWSWGTASDSIDPGQCG